MGERVWLSNVYPLTGSMEGFIFAVVIFTSAGRSFFIWSMADCMRCRLISISAFQLIKADISQLPRLVVLRTICRSGTCLMAFSSGLVTVTIILLTGCKPSSAITFILGKVTSGNNEVCILVYTNTPPKMISARTRLIGFLCVRKVSCIGVFNGVIAQQF